MLKDRFQQGFIPIIILLLAGIIVATGGVLVVRQQFVKKEVGKKAALDEKKIKDQINNPSDLGTALKVNKISDTPAGAIFTYTSKESISEPSFTINPPSGWKKGDESKFSSDVRVYFETDPDREDLTPPLYYSFPPQITVLFIKNEGVKSLDQAVSARLDALKNQGDNLLSSRSAKINNQDVWIMEFTWKEKSGNVLLHQLEYIFLPKEGFMVMVDGVALDSAWTSRRTQIQSSFNTLFF